MYESGRQRRRRTMTADFYMAIGAIVPSAYKAGCEMHAHRVFNTLSRGTMLSVGLHEKRKLIEDFLKEAGHDIQSDKAYQDVLKLSGRQQFLDSFTHIQIRF